MSAHPVVLLHPLGADHRFWDPVLPHLADHTVHAIDICGHGSSPEIPVNSDIDTPTEALAAQLRSLVDALGVSSVHLVGVSLGGLIAQRLAVMHPSLVRSVTLADTVAHYPAAMQRMWDDRADAVRRNGTEQFVQPTLDLWFSDKLRGRDDERITQTTQTLTEMSAEAYARACELLRDVDLRSGLSQIDVPALIVCGEHDGPAFVQAAPLLQEEIRGSQLHWLPGGHAAVLEDPALFARAFDDFLTSAFGPKEKEHEQH